jgi:hypothetical protein
MASTQQIRKVKHSRINQHYPDKIVVYQHLLLLNLHARAIGEILKELAGKHSILKNEAKYFALMIEEARASISQSVAERMDAREIDLSAIASRRRLQIEKQLRGSDI